MGKSQLYHYYRFSEIFTRPNTSVTVLAPNHHYMISAVGFTVQSRAPLSAELACWWQKMLIQAFEVRATEL